MKKTWIALCLLPFFCGAKAQNPSEICLNKEEMQVYLEYPEEVKKQGIFNGNEKATELIMQYRVPLELQASLFQLVVMQEIKKTTYNYLYPDSVYKRVQFKQRVENEYADSIDKILIPYNDISGPNLRIALEFPQSVRLKEKQYHTIMDKALKMRKERLKNPKVNLWEKEFLFLDSVLNKKQLRSFFVCKYASTITEEMHKDWKKLKENNLSEEQDSTSACAQIYMYYLSAYQVNDLYKYNTTKRQIALKAIEAKAPRAVLLLRGLKRKEQAEKAIRTKGKNKKEEKGNLFW